MATSRSLKQGKATDLSDLWDSPGTNVYYFCTIPRHHSSQPKKTAARQSVITRLCSLNGAKAIKELAEVLPSQQKQWIRMGRLWGEIWRNNLKRWLLNITLGELGDHPGSHPTIMNQIGGIYQLLFFTSDIFPKLQLLPKCSLKCEGKHLT